VLVDTAAERFASAVIPPALAGDTEHLLRRACVRAREVTQGVLPEGIQPRDYAILGVLAASDAISQQELAGRLNINRTVMVKLIDRLEHAGLVTRTRNPADRRSHSLSLTPAGRLLRERMEPAVNRGEAALTAPLQSAERDRLNQLLRRLLPDLDGGLPRPPAQRTGYLLIHADLRLHRRGDQVLTPTGLQMRHFGALATVAQRGPCTQQELAHQLGVTETAMVQVVDELHGQGLVERDRDPRDRRRYALLLSGDGQARLAAARRALDPVHAEVTELLGEDGDAELRHLLAKLV
jgi:DNA-binding MarR family transcriptional regulator